jgi:hypothetical protein
MQNKLKYYIRFSILSIGAILIAYGLSTLNTKYFITTHYWIPTLFFAITTIATNLFLTKFNSQSKEFILITLAMSMARLLLCMVFVFVYSLINKLQALAFTCHFMIQYVLFTIFEITFLLKHINSNQQTQTNQ